MQKIKMKEYKHMCFDIIENDPEHGHGYSEVYDTEDDNGEPAYGCALYTDRLPLDNIPDYQSAAEKLTELSAAKLYKCETVTDAVNIHLHWWFKPPITDKEAAELDLYIGTYEEITAFLKKGFNEPRIFFSCIEWQN